MPLLHGNIIPDIYFNIILLCFVLTIVLQSITVNLGFQQSFYTGKGVLVGFVTKLTTSITMITCGILLLAFDIILPKFIAIGILFIIALLIEYLLMWLFYRATSNNKIIFIVTFIGNAITFIIYYLVVPHMFG